MIRYTRVLDFALQAELIQLRSVFVWRGVYYLLQIAGTSVSLFPTPVRDPRAPTRTSAVAAPVGTLVETKPLIFRRIPVTLSLHSLFTLHWSLLFVDPLRSQAQVKTKQFHPCRPDGTRDTPPLHDGGANTASFSQKTGQPAGHTIVDSVMVRSLSSLPTCIH